MLQLSLQPTAAIVAITVFHLSFKPTGTLLGFAEVGQVSPFTVWLALTLTLLYVVMRYHHSDETRKDRAYVAEQFRELRRVAIIHRIESGVRRYFLQGVPVGLFDDFAEFLDGDIERHMTRDGRASEVDDLQVGTADPDAAQPWWRGRVSVSFHAVWPGGSYGRYGSGQPAFTLQRPDRIRVSAVAAVRAVTRSRAGVDIGLPYTMAALAALTSLYRLAFFFPV
ncbi:hypothetical protein PQR75_42875 [Paraburkholderia fungorum]|uniref:hypothetical protein n=1 Tax=Paraburkholderia fungorum TaxID=134537 RepID=UPI0038BAEE7B